MRKTIEIEDIQKLEKWLVALDQTRKVIEDKWPDAEILTTPLTEIKAFLIEIRDTSVPPTTEKLKDLVGKLAEPTEENYNPALYKNVIAARKEGRIDDQIV